MKNLMVYACQSIVPDVNIEWTLPRGVNVATSPQILPPLYNLEKWVIYAVFNGKVNDLLYLYVIPMYYIIVLIAYMYQ